MYCKREQKHAGSHQAPLLDFWQWWISRITASTSLHPSKSYAHPSFDQLLICSYTREGVLRNVPSSKVVIMQCITVVTHQSCGEIRAMNMERNCANRERGMKKQRIMFSTRDGKNGWSSELPWFPMAYQFQTLYILRLNFPFWSIWMHYLANKSLFI